MPGKAWICLAMACIQALAVERTNNRCSTKHSMQTCCKGKLTAKFVLNVYQPLNVPGWTG
jgi:hypothetical protein